MIYLIIILAFISRIISLNQSLWWDEAINVVYARSNDFWFFVTKYPIGDFHPPGYFAILWVWGHLFGFSEISVRFPSLIFGLVTIFLTYLIGAKLFSKKIGLLAALFLSLSPLHIYYSQEARMYSFATLSAALASYFFIKLINNEKFSFLGYSLSVILVLYSDYVAYLILAAHIIYVSTVKKEALKKFILSLSLGALPIIPWLYIFPKQLINGLTISNIVGGWRSVVGGTGVKELLLLPAKIMVGKITFNNKLIYLWVLSIGSIPYLFSFRKTLKNLSKNIILIYILLILPVFLAFIFSFLIPIFSYFRLLFILPFLYILLAVGLNEYKFKTKRLLIILIIIYEVLAAGIYLLNPNFQREDWKGALNFVNKNSDFKTLTLHKNNEIPATLTYYQSPSTKSLPAFKKIPVTSDLDLNNLEQNLSLYNRVFIFNYLVDITDPKKILESKVEAIGFKKHSEYDFRGVGLVELYVK